MSLAAHGQAAAPLAEVVLVRHGQANAAATDEASYDKLSQLGHQQATWLGEWLRATEVEFDRAISGSLIRHRETAAAMATGETVVDARWNEISYFPLSTAYADHHGVSEPDQPEDFADYFLGLAQAWEADSLPGAPETWLNFRGRVLSALDAQREAGGRTLVVTSGGVIGLAVSAALGLGTDGMARLAVAIENTSMHRLVWRGGRWRMLEFGASPHLATPDRVHARTYI
ncbi:MAG: histidine phosphatase family protein [Pseudomonadota bacterium]